MINILDLKLIEEYLVKPQLTVSRSINDQYRGQRYANTIQCN